MVLVYSLELHLRDNLNHECILLWLSWDSSFFGLLYLQGLKSGPKQLIS